MHFSRFIHIFSHYSWFSCDVTKILKSKPGGLQNFYLLLRKELPKNISLHNNLARNLAFFWQQNSFNFRIFIVRDIRRTAVAELFRTFNMTLPAIFSILNNVSIRRNICLNFRKFTSENKPLFLQKWTPDLFSYFRSPCLCPFEGHKYGVSILISINLRGTLCQITRVREAAQTWGLDRVLIYSSSITCQFFYFIHWMVFDFYFDGVTVKTGNSLDK